MTRETKSYELKIYDQSLMRFEAAYDAFGSLKLEITDIDSANAHLLPLNLPRRLVGTRGAFFLTKRKKFRAIVS